MSLWGRGRVSTTFQESRVDRLIEAFRNLEKRLPSAIDAYHRIQQLEVTNKALAREVLRLKEKPIVDKALGEVAEV